MTRFTTAAVAALLLAAAPVLAQTTRPQEPVTPRQTTAPAPSASPTPGSEEWLRLRGESYRAAPESEQDPAEVEATMRLNAEIAARNNAAERRETEGNAAWQAEQARWRAETARIETERAQWEADNAAAEAARLRYEREMAAWEARVAECRRAPGGCIEAGPAPKY